MESPNHVQIREKGKEIKHKVSSPPPPSSSSSPSLVFSFTTSLHPTTPPLTPLLNITNKCTNNASTSSLATIDLSPADKIFLGGQILPLQAVPHTKVSPRNSCSSAENFTLPLDRIESDLSQRYRIANYSNKNETPRTKPKPLSDILRIGNWRAKTEQTELRNENRTKASKKRLELGQVLKRFMSMVENIFSYNRREKEQRDLQKRPHSFSVHSNPRERDRWRKRRGQRSAPASIRGSPSHSGHFSMGSINKLSSSSDESTMEELQNAIEAAIAHCKSSIGAKGGQV
ncbi:BRI1 kinase inhibitor 1 [Rhynchospora pubera]|uniref:BRI1 kinase inhibitor 1 n=1 Tax=Rhynchospora pubera TaxID=906938 RepID=A0AAV8G7J1_9POAL|nr:BRI1 kinase inhibitor 1 [Rhynchospora pubera]